jgi:hypothetical protein
MRPIVVTSLVAALASGALACGAKAGLSFDPNDAAPDADDPAPCELPEPALPITSISDTPDRCVIRGRDGRGREHALDCDGARCQWRTEGRVTCECDDLDYANVCGRGGPLCVRLELFDLSTWPP